MFDEKHIMEVIAPDNTGQRYCLCRNPRSAERETRTRKALLGVTRTALEKIAQSKRKGTPEAIGKRVGKAFAKTKMEKFVQWEVKEGRLLWSFKPEVGALGRGQGICRGASGWLLYN